MPDPKPIKRSKELAPLSREHHEGLLFVFKIRQGLKLNIPNERIGSFCNWSWHSHFGLHFKKEEKELPPVLGTAHPLIAQMLEEHKNIKNLFEKSGQNPGAALLEQLAQSINDHIRFEERQLFPLIEQTATPARLQAIAQALAAEKPVAAAWADEFWVTPR